ncbi:ribosome-associated protein [Flavobacteriaceae bacterium MAR_2010_72]|nr:ribosome-associated protein [Flavobacteriaceae bacterium MAR_2010_72]TVZ58051.1 ribosome-associated protein [Flavobacteriaceae bacterium MAR_2010_105]
MFDEKHLISELNFKAVRSSGAGGQHVNKTASKVELTFGLMESSALSDEQKSMLKKSLSSRLTNDNGIILYCEESRSQHKNKALVIERFLELIKQGLVVPKKRKKTKVPKAVKLKRLKSKKETSQKKENRKPPEIN